MIRRPLIAQTPCEDCEHRIYAGYGVWECRSHGETCEAMQFTEWVDDTAHEFATKIATWHHIERNLRYDFATSVCDAFSDLLYSVGAKLDRDEFLRRCDVPVLKEVK
jgi:hypothetical protein